MHQKFTSQQDNERDWLEEIYQNNKNRSLEIGIKAIKALVNEGSSVSYRTVASKSKELDPTGRGIHQNTIKNNKELHNYFEKYCSSKKYNVSKKASKALLEDLDAYKHIKIDRNIDRVRQRYMQLTKPELIEMIIKMEQYISHQNKQWLKNEFEKFQ